MLHRLFALWPLPNLGRVPPVHNQSLTRRSTPRLNAPTPLGNPTLPAPSFSPAQDCIPPLPPPRRDRISLHIRRPPVPPNAKLECAPPPFPRSPQRRQDIIPAPFA